MKDYELSIDSRLVFKYLANQDTGNWYIMLFSVCTATLTQMSLIETQGYAELFCPCLIILSPLKNKASGTNNKVSHIPTDFLQWFSGFSDAEGKFLISLTLSPRGKIYVRFRFKISVHIDDIEALNLISTTLGTGRVVKEKNNYCSFVIQDFNEILETICPIFNAFPLQTNKRLDYLDFYEAVLIKNSKGQDLSFEDLENIKVLKNKMNSQRDNKDIVNLNNTNINLHWLVGFLEGDGTFGLKNGHPYFQVAQKDNSIKTLEAIASYISCLPFNNENKILLEYPELAKYLRLKENLKSDPDLMKEEVKNIISKPNVTLTSNKKTNVVSLVVSSVDSLYYYLLPLLQKGTLRTRKSVDF